MDHKWILLKEASKKQELTNWENILIEIKKGIPIEILKYHQQIIELEDSS